MRGRTTTGLGPIVRVLCAVCLLFGYSGGGYAGSFTVGGTLAGLAGGQSVRLGLNSEQELLRTSSGSFTFPTGLASGVHYVVRVLVQPAGQYCQISAGNGTLQGASVSNVNVQCNAALVNQVNVLGPPRALAPGETSVVRVQIAGGNNILGGQFRLCVPGAELTFGTPEIPPELNGLNCGMVTAGNCPAGTSVGVSCIGISFAGNWTLPAVARFPVQIAAGASTGTKPVLLSSTPPPLFTNAMADELVPSSHSGNLYVGVPIPASLGLIAPARASQSQSASVALQIRGSNVSGANVRVCFDESRLQFAVPIIPASLNGLVCSLQGVDQCLAPSTRSLHCLGGQASHWATPQTLSLPFQVRVNASLGLTRVQVLTGASLLVSGSSSPVNAPEQQIELLSDALFRDGLEPAAASIDAAKFIAFAFNQP